ncbi:hypothetical protein PFISCL1PPCAC_14406, partial [Pristionchus fissidentatus]
FSMLASHIIQLLYGFCGVAAYLIVIYAMYALRRILHRSFITIFCIMAIINIATWLNSWVSIRLLNEPLFFFYYEWASQNHLFRTTLNFLVPQFYFAQNICLLLLTIDRFAAVFAVSMDTK